MHVVMNHSSCNTGINHETDVVFGVSRFLMLYSHCLIIRTKFIVNILKKAKTTFLKIGSKIILILKKIYKRGGGGGKRKRY